MRNEMKYLNGIHSLEDRENIFCRFNSLQHSDVCSTYVISYQQRIPNTQEYDLVPFENFKGFTGFATPKNR